MESSDEIVDHTEAKFLHRTYLAKIEERKPHQDYADRVARATAGGGQTPVEPLATMGPGGGPLLCDVCHKPIILEGGEFQGVPADVAWKRNPKEGWRSWISGGMVVEITINGTLRIYHGYQGNAKHCCDIGHNRDEEARKAFDKSKGDGKLRKVLAYLESDFPDMTESERDDLASNICVELFDYDPGLGVNRP